MERGGRVVLLSKKKELFIGRDFLRNLFAQSY